MEHRIEYRIVRHGNWPWAVAWDANPYRTPATSWDIPWRCEYPMGQHVAWDIPWDPMGMRSVRPMVRPIGRHPNVSLGTSHGIGMPHDIRLSRGTSHGTIGFLWDIPWDTPWGVLQDFQWDILWDMKIPWDTQMNDPWPMGHPTGHRMGRPTGMQNVNFPWDTLWSSHITGTARTVKKTPRIATIHHIEGPKGYSGSHERDTVDKTPRSEDAILECSAFVARVEHKTSGYIATYCHARTRTPYQYSVMYTMPTYSN